MKQLAWVQGDSTPLDRAACLAVQRELMRAGWHFVADAGAADAVLMWTRSGFAEDELIMSSDPGRTVVLLGPTVTADMPALVEASGIVSRSWTPPHPSRLRPEGPSTWCAEISPLGEDIEVFTPVLEVDKVRDSVDVWLSAPWGLKRQPMLTYRRETGVMVFAPHLGHEEATSADHRAVARLLHFALRRVGGPGSARHGDALGVGLLGYGAIGAEHARAAEQVPGLDLAVVCDRNRDRLEAVAASSARVRTTTDAAELLGADVDVLVVSTPPDTHAEWAVRALEAGKHVIVEKPLTITTSDADEVLATAQRVGRRVVSYQNRRFDPDFLAVRHQIDDGSLGEVFHTETFIGGYAHPCNYWHSDADVSGGAIYDWGSHVIDQLLALTPARISHVTCVEHKRRWHDVSNADHTSLLLRFDDGSEASFVHSDLAAALKPRWFVLGTRGGLVSEWRTTSVLSRNEIGTLAEDRLAVTDTPPDIVRYGSDGARTAVSLPPARKYPFHIELVDDLVHDWPMTVTPQQSRRVVAVMEAARESAQLRGAPATVAGEA